MNQDVITFTQSVKMEINNLKQQNRVEGHLWLNVSASTLHPENGYIPNVPLALNRL
jgi:hypothetical protein